ncbi:MAG: 2-octaprenyl-6-methoxyphenyl hydroxylase [Gammaproteobacteria bacterium]
MLHRSEYDIVIVGGGMVGASLACALADEETDIALIDAAPLKPGKQPSYDDRALALSLSSQRVFTALKLWPQIAVNANPIQRIHVSDRGHFGFVRLQADMLGLDNLGHVVIARDLGKALISRIKAAVNIDFICPAMLSAVTIEQDRVRMDLINGDATEQFSGKLLVVADGTHSTVREQLGIRTRIRDYGQTAIIANATTEKPHRDTAYERFTEGGPFALLPLKEQRCKMVFTLPAGESEEYMKMDREAFLAKAQQRFGKRLGRFKTVGSRLTHPLLLLEAQQQTGDRIVLLGNAAHTIHPNGAQGFNLCLRDVAALAEQLISVIRSGKDPGGRQALDDYLSCRHRDQQRVMRFSERLADLFYNRHRLKIFARNTGMLITDLVPALKRECIRQGAGITGLQPAIVRGL